MHNYPDDIGSYCCPYCKEVLPNCICDNENEQLDNECFDDALRGSDEDTYYEMFNSMDSDEVINLLRNYHADQSKESSRNLIKFLDKMLINYIKEKY